MIPNKTPSSLYLEGAELDAARASANEFPSLSISGQPLGQLEMLLSGLLSPLCGYLDQADYQSVIEKQRLTDGTLWAMPLTLRADGQFADTLSVGDEVALRDSEGVLIATLAITSIWQDENGPALAGPVTGIAPPTRYAFPQLYFHQSQAAAGAALQQQPSLGLFCRKPLSAALQQYAQQQSEQLGALVWVYNCGAPPPIDDHRFSAQVRIQKRQIEAFPAGQAAQLRLLPIDLTDTLAGALNCVLIAQNLGHSHCLISSRWQSDLAQYRSGFSIKPIFYPAEVAEDADDHRGDEDWTLLRPPRSAQGLTIFFTGLSGSGKSTLANTLLVRLFETGLRRATLLDGDHVRQQLSSELGFSKSHRDLNIMRIAYVASEITKHGGIAICAPIAPYTATRRRVRQMIEAHGGFFEVYVATPLSVCEERDRKGLYAKARAGVIAEFTGISDPYEAPQRAELTIDTSRCSPTQAVDQIIAGLTESGFLPTPKRTLG